MYELVLNDDVVDRAPLANLEQAKMFFVKRKQMTESQFELIFVEDFLKNSLSLILQLVLSMEYLYHHLQVLGLPILLKNLILLYSIIQPLVQTEQRFSFTTQKLLRHFFQLQI